MVDESAKYRIWSARANFTSAKASSSTDRVVTTVRRHAKSIYSRNLVYNALQTAVERHPVTVRLNLNLNKHYQRHFFEAISIGDSATISQLLDAGINVNVRSDEGNTALCHAIINGNTAIVETLLEACPDLRVEPPTPEAAIPPFGLEDKSRTAGQQIIGNLIRDIYITYFWSRRHTLLRDAAVTIVRILVVTCCIQIRTRGTLERIRLVATLVLRVARSPRSCYSYAIS